MNRRIAATVVLFALVAVVASGCTTKVLVAPSGQAVNTVTAQGTGSVSAAPDEAEMTFGVTTTDPNAKTALANASATAAKITAALVKTGIDPKDIQTQNVSVNPNYANSGTPNPAITGYTASISVVAKVRDIGKLGSVITAANAAGANSVGGPTFTIADDSAYRAQAIDKAVADARTTAAAMAKAAGKRLGPVVSMSQTSAQTPVPLFSAGVAKADAAVPISPGTLDVTAQATVVFELQ